MRKTDKKFFSFKVGNCMFILDQEGVNKKVCSCKELNLEFSCEEISAERARYLQQFNEST